MREATRPPNIVLIYADDLGWGDIGCLNPESKIPTPHMDALAARGMSFTDAHAPGSVCSASRYGIMTGRYSWRTSVKAGIIYGDHPPWIEPGRMTLASLLSDRGYDTAAIGKWHLGSDCDAAARPGRDANDCMPSGIDFSRPVHSGHAAGFTYDFLHLDWNAAGPEFARSYPGGHGSTLLPDMQDCARWYFENGLSEGGDPDFLAFDMREAQLRFGERCVEYIEAKGSGAPTARFNQQDDAPFFLYYAPPMPHTPVVPADRFVGMSGAGLYGDFVCEFDWIVGQIVEALDRNGLLENTMVVVSSDNGPENTCYPRIREFDHASMGPFRGVKRDMWETGHRMPFIVSWPGVVEPGSTCDAVVGQTDLLPTFADMLAVSMPEDAAEDGVSILPLLRGERDAVRESIVYHACEGPLAIRRGDWVLMEEPSVVSWQIEPAWFREERGIVSEQPGPELFSLAEDPYQRHNLFHRHPAMVAELSALLAEQVASGRSACI